MALSVEVPRETTFESTAAQTLDGLWAAVHRSACPREVRSLLSSMVLPWGDRPIPQMPQWPSDIGDDHSPYEFSLALSRNAADIRFLVEAQGRTHDFLATRDASLRLNEMLASRGADLRLLRRVREVLLPDVRNARFALWHAVALAPGPLRAKAYFNPQIRGVGRAVALVHEALERLGMQRAWSTLSSMIPRRWLRGSALRYLALDLEASDSARVKLYFQLNDMSTHTLERIAALRPEYVRGEATEFYRGMTGSMGTRNPRPICVYVAFTRKSALPSAITVQIPVRFFAPNDRVVRDRVRSYLRFRSIDVGRYDRALQSISRRPIDARRGLHTYVSLRTGLAEPRLTIYFAAQLYQSSRAQSGTYAVASRPVGRIA